MSLHFFIHYAVQISFYSWYGESGQIECSNLGVGSFQKNSSLFYELLISLHLPRAIPQTKVLAQDD